MKDDLFGIYVHVPFCRRRCVYCNFYFELGKPSANFYESILKEYEYRKIDWPSNAHTLYFGGGTPSLLDCKSIQTLIEQLAPNASEITLELNPEDATVEYLTSLKLTEVNRLSFGIQSFEDNILKYLGRKHRSDSAKHVIIQAQKIGYKNISVDLIGGILNENILPSIRWLVDNQIKHISAYILTLEPETNLEKLINNGKRLPLCEDKQADAYIDFQTQLLNQGFCQYEISNFAIPGYESIHNRIYWSKGVYLGLGPGAHSMRIDKNGSSIRRENVNGLKIWERNPIIFPFKEEILTPLQSLMESLAFGLRDLKYGINLTDLSKKHKHQIPSKFENLMEIFKKKRWIEKNTNYHLTALGARFSDSVAREILDIIQ